MLLERRTAVVAARGDTRTGCYSRPVLGLGSQQNLGSSPAVVEARAVHYVVLAGSAAAQAAEADVHAASVYGLSGSAAAECAIEFEAQAVISCWPKTAPRVSALGLASHFHLIAPTGGRC